MKTIGVIGGMSWQSSAEYYRLFNQLVATQLGVAHSAKLILFSVDFAEIAALTIAGNWTGIGKIVSQAAQKLELAGADLIVLATNTIHKESDAITNKISIPFLHIAAATGNAIKSQGLKKVGLLGTKHTMEFDFYSGYLADHFGIEVVTPDSDSRNRLNTFIYDELVRGKFSAEAKNYCLNLIKQMIDTEQIEGVILGCTELPMLIPATEIDIASFDTTTLHVSEAVEWCLKAK